MMNWRGKSVLVMATILCATPAHAQIADQRASVDSGPSLTGAWVGRVVLVADTTPITLRVQSLNPAVYGGYVELPAMGLFENAGMRIQQIGDSITIAVRAISAVFVGRRVSQDTIRGRWYHAGATTALTLVRVSRDYAREARPQEPAPPFPYEEDEFRAESRIDSAVIAGALTVPHGDGPFPAVVLIGGTGLQDRDGTAMGHRPFRVIADYLGRRGIAVLRLDERGIGDSGGSSGEISGETIARDVQTALEQVARDKRIDTAKLGIIGHSEGGLIAATIAQRSRLPKYLVLLATPGISMRDLYHHQTKTRLAAAGMDSTRLPGLTAFTDSIYVIVSSADTAEMRTRLRALFANSAFADVLALTMPGRADQSIHLLQVPATRWTARQNPEQLLGRLHMPVLALIGANDPLVPAAPNIAAINRIMRKAGNNAADVRQLPGLTHMFVAGELGGIFDYGMQPETFAPVALEVIADWILKLR